MCDLGVCYSGVSPKLVGEFRVDLVVGCPFVYLDWAHFNSWFLCSLLTYVCRFRMAPVCVPVGTPLSQYGVIWAVCILGMLVGLSRRAPLFVGWSAI